MLKSSRQQKAILKALRPLTRRVWNWRLLQKAERTTQNCFVGSSYSTGHRRMAGFRRNRNDCKRSTAQAQANARSQQRDDSQLPWCICPPWAPIADLRLGGHRNLCRAAFHPEALTPKTLGPQKPSNSPSSHKAPKATGLLPRSRGRLVRLFKHGQGYGRGQRV